MSVLIRKTETEQTFWDHFGANSLGLSTKTAVKMSSELCPCKLNKDANST